MFFFKECEGAHRKKCWRNIAINKSATCLPFTFQPHSSLFCIQSSGPLYQHLLLPGNHIPHLFKAGSVPSFNLSIHVIFLERASLTMQH